MLAAACPGCFLTGFTGHLTAHGCVPFVRDLNEPEIYPRGYKKGGWGYRRRMKWRIGIITTVVASLAGGVWVTGSATATSPFAENPTQSQYLDIPVQETGRVLVVADGDTFRFIPDGQTDYVTVRLLGVNTPEIRGFYNSNRETDMCGGPEATNVLKSVLPPGTPVQLRALDSESESRGRIQRYAFALNPATGQYDIDVQAVVAQSGLAMWFTVKNESTLSYQYRVMIAQTQLAGIGIWDPLFCGPIEQPNANVSVIVNWDAPGNDNDNINGEFITVRNIGDREVDLSGWLLRDSSLTSWFYFPQGSILAPNDYRVVRAGTGNNGFPDPRDLYMGSTTALFPNPQPGKFLGDGAYLLDKRTAVRSYYEYPCVLDCTDPMQGVLRISSVNAVATATTAAKRANQEYVKIKNTGSLPALLDGYYLRRGLSTYPFLVNTVIAPGKTLTVRIGKGTPTRFTQYWGQNSTLLNDNKDKVSLLSNRNVLISQKSWG
jgi:micrococcal nuclease